MRAKPVAGERGTRAPTGSAADRPSGHAHVLYGRHVTDVPGLYLALGKAVGGPGGYLGADLHALADCLGGFGHSGPATLLRQDSAVAREHCPTL